MDSELQSRGLRRLSTESVIVLTLLIALCAQSCKSSKTKVISNSQSTIDNYRGSTDYELVYCTDTVVMHEADTAMMSALVKCDSLGNAYLAQIATLQGERVKQNLTTEQRQDGLKICLDAIAQTIEDHVEVYKYEHKYTDTTSTHQEQEIKQVEKTTKKPPDALRAFLAGLLLGMGGMCILMLYLKNHTNNKS